MTGFTLGADGVYRIEKDPDDTLPYSIQWYDWLRGANKYWAPRVFVRPGEIYTPSKAALNGHAYRCTTGGTTATTEPTWPTSATVTDGGVVWTEIGLEDTVSTSAWAAGDLTDTGAAIDSTGCVTTVTLAGLTAGQDYEVTNSIVTTAGKHHDQSFVINCREQ